MVSPLLRCFSLRVRRNGEGRSFSLSLSLSLTRCCFPVGKNACEGVFPCTDRGGAPPRFPLRLSRCWLNGFSASPAVMRFSVQGGILVRTADCPWRRAVRFRGGTIPVPGDPLQHSLRQGEEEGQAPGRIPEIREMPSEFSERGFEDEEGVRRTISRPECVAALMSWSQGDAGGGLFSPSCGTFARFLNAGGHREEGNRLAASGRGDKKGGAG